MQQIVEGETVQVECLDTGTSVEGIVVTMSIRQVRINLFGVPMTFRPDTKGAFTAQQSGLSFVIRTS